MRVGTWWHLMAAMGPTQSMNYTLLTWFGYFIVMSLCSGVLNALFLANCLTRVDSNPEFSTVRIRGWWRHKVAVWVSCPFTVVVQYIVTCSEAVQFPRCCSFWRPSLLAVTRFVNPALPRTKQLSDMNKYRFLLQADCYGRTDWVREDCGVVRLTCRLRSQHNCHQWWAARVCCSEILVL